MKHKAKASGNVECGIWNVEGNSQQSAIRIPHSEVVSSAGWGLGRPAAGASDAGAGQRRSWRAIGWGLVALLAGAFAGSAHAALTEREPVTFKVAVVNPSADKTQTVPVRMNLPQEVTPKDVLNKGELALEYDETKSSYYLYKEAVQLAPKETRLFEAQVRDVWFIPQTELDSLKNYTSLVLGRIEKTEYFATAKGLAQSIAERLDRIAATQNDESLSRKTRMGAYRYHLQAIAQIKEDLAKMEKLLTFTGGPPVPAMLEESALKSDAPSTTTTWLVIFLIVIFIGLLGGQFFFTWHRRMQVTQELVMVKQMAFPSTHAAAAPTSSNGTKAPTRQEPVGTAPRQSGSGR